MEGRNKISLWKPARMVSRFIQAARTGNVKLVVACLKEGVNPNTIFDGTTIIHTCVEMEHKNMLHAVINNAHNMNLNIQTDQGDTALLLACKKSINIRMILFLLKFGADPNVCNNNLRYPIHEAVLNKSIFLVQKLIKFNAELNVLDVFGNSPISLASINTRNIPMIKCLVKNNANVNISRGYERPFFLDLCLSCRDNKDLMIIEYLLENGINEQMEDPISKDNALHCAVSSDNEELTSLLLKYFVNLQKVNAAGLTPIELAKHFRHDSLAISLEERLHYLNRLAVADDDD